MQIVTLADIKENLDCCICTSVMFLYSLLSFEAAEFESFIESPFELFFVLILHYFIVYALHLSIFANNVLIMIAQRSGVYSVGTKSLALSVTKSAGLLGFSW